MRFEFHREAVIEYREAADHYAERDPDAARRFVEAVETTIARIIESPRAWSVIDDDVRRCLTRVFPYGVLYSLESDYILILAVMHCSRMPGYWKRRKRT